MTGHAPRLWVIALLLPLLPGPFSLAHIPAGQAGAAESPPPHYLILAPAEYTTALQPLLALKQAQGFTTSLRTLEECGNTPTEIKKACLRDTYTRTTSPLYVLLVGDTDRLPAWTSQINPNRQTDLYYTTMDGSWDVTPNFYLGRLPVQSADELSRAIAAWQAYAGLAGDEPWLRRAAFLATHHPDERLATEATLNDLISTYTIPRGYQGNFPNPDTPGGDHLYAYTYAADRAAVRAALNNGRSLVVYLGEVSITALPGGDTLSAWKAPAFDQNDVRALSANPIPLVLSLAGRSADFTLSEGLGETWVRNAEHGALVFIGAAQETQWALDRALARAFSAALFAEPTPTLGQALHTALTTLAADYPDDARRYWEAYTLLGDPSLRPRLFSLAGDFSLAVQPTRLALCAGSATTVQVTLQPLQGFSAPVSLALVDPPPGVQGAFFPTRLTLPANSTLTLSADVTSPAGSHLLTLQATTETRVHSLLFPLQVVVTPPLSPGLTTPALGASGVPLQPTFTWQGDTDAVTYTLEIARDSAFIQPVQVISELTQTNFVPPEPLPANTLLYWRVRAHNPCGEHLSTTGFFTTRPLPGTCPAGATPLTLYATNVAATEAAWQSQDWAITSTEAHSPPYAFHTSGPASPATHSLISPPLTMPAAAETLPHTLTFWLRTNLEGNGVTCYDGLVLQASFDDGINWETLPLTTYLEGAPTGILVSSQSNPLGGRIGWCGTFGWMPVRVDLTDYAGRSLRLRWIVSSDDRNESLGAWVDDVQITTCQSPPRYALTLLPAISEQVPQEGEIVTHSLTLTNSGSAAATVDLALTPGAWPATRITPAAFSLAAGENAEIQVAVTLPTNGASTEDTATLTATVREQAGVSVQATLHSRRHHYAFTLTTPNLNLESPPGAVVPLPLLLQNTGTLPLALDLRVTSSQGWEIAPLTVPDLTAGETRTLALFVSVPTAAAAGLVDTLTVDAQARTTASLAQHLEITLTVLPHPQPEVTVLNLPPYLPRGYHAMSEIRVTNRGNFRDTLIVDTSAAAPLEATLAPGCGNFALDSGTDATCLLALHMPAGAEKGRYPLEVCAASTYDPQARHCQQVTLMVTDWLTFLPLVGR